MSRIRARQVFAEMESWAHSAEALVLPVDAVEREMERRGREACRLMLQSNVDARGTGHVGPRLEVLKSAGGVDERRAAREDERKVVSIFGPVRARRTACTARARETVRPLDEMLELPARGQSYEVQRRLIEEVVRGPFDEAVAALERNTGNRLSKRTAEQLALEASRDFEAFYARRSAPRAARTGPVPVAAVDCKGVPMVKPGGAEHRVRLKKGDKANKKKMATVATAHTQLERVRTAEEVVASLFKDGPREERPRVAPEHKRVWASLERPMQDVFRELATEVARRDPRGVKKRALVMDGQRSLWRRAGRRLKGFVLVLDLLHVLEYLWKAAPAFFGEGTPQAEAWVRNHALMILEGRVSQVIKGMRQSATKRGLRGARRKAVESAANYFRANRSRMRYDQYLAQGLPIASGTVEGACKNLVEDRMERSGMRWQIPGAEAVLKLRAIYLGRDMQQYWTFHKRQEQLRLYGHLRWKTAS
ncbi:MAG: ISKra4 family transposase [Deferrisomatales bacterium]|nr:ISKra4 family transposase [Deferrisomatales bacterium]